MHFRKLVPLVASFTLFFHAEQVISLQLPKMCSFVANSSCINLCSCIQTMSCFVESAEAISSGIFPSFWSVWTLKAAMKMPFFPFISLELIFFVWIALVSAVDFSTATWNVIAERAPWLTAQRAMRDERLGFCVISYFQRLDWKLWSLLHTSVSNTLYQSVCAKPKQSTLVVVNCLATSNLNQLFNISIIASSTIQHPASRCFHLYHG